MNLTTDPASSVRIKVCGLTNKADLKAAIAAGVHAIGLVFYPPSPRNVTLEQAETLSTEIPPFVTVTGLFVNASRLEIERTCRRCRLDLIQLHGDEPPAFCLDQPRRVIKGIRVDSRADLLNLENYPVSGLLLDAKAKGLYGGSGQSFDWSLLASFASPAPLILAGGLNPDNVTEAIRQVKPHAVDVSSGVESEPGVKDHKKIIRFIQAVNQAQ
ncbi:MAG: phosphoribosylanthranilate isomerase [Magnetococcales bacterium]|nr:phosphoribosylanthranilate isomerase [Magnetococcales bacterium]